MLGVEKAKKERRMIVAILLIQVGVVLVYVSTIGMCLNFIKKCKRKIGIGDYIIACIPAIRVFYMIAEVDNSSDTNNNR